MSAERERTLDDVPEPTQDDPSEDAGGGEEDGGEEDGGEAHEAPPPSVRRIAREVRLRATTLRCTLAAVAAWAITVAPLAVNSRASLPTRLLAVLSIAPGLMGPQLIARSQRSARHVGVTAYLALVLGAWAFASSDQVLASVDIFRAVLGVIAWGVFGLSWSHPWSVPDVDLERAPEGETAGLKPRRKTPQSAVVVAAAGAVCAVICLGLAWTIEEPNRAVFGQAIAIGAAIALLTSASTISVIAGRDRRRDRGKLPINRGVLNTVLLMLLVSAAAVSLWWSR